MTELTVLPNAQAAAHHAAREIARILTEALERRGVAHLALSGGSTPRPAYTMLAGLLDDWSAVEMWYGDERCVPPEDPESTHKLVADTLLANIHGPAQPTEHRVLGELGPEEAARAYAAQLRARVAPAEADGSAGRTGGAGGREGGAGGRAGGSAGRAGGLPALDIALLGIGEDGHTASLFPGHSEVEDDSGALCLPVRDSPKPPPERVTLSFPVLRAARNCLLLVAGAGKASALTAVLAGPDPRIPASLLASERLQIVADTAAHPASGGVAESSTDG
jgi:6-phosphogluconolactonase